MVGLALIGSMAACGSTGSGSASEETSVSATSEKGSNGVTGDSEVSPDKITTADSNQGSSEGKVVTNVSSSSGEAIDTTDLFTDRDLAETADLSEAVTYTVSDGQDIAITAAGVYVITGSASNVTISVEVTDDEKVQLVLDGANITNDSKPVVFVKNADKVFVTTASGTENNLSVTGTFEEMDGTNTDAVIFSKDDLVLNGLGTLNISSTDNGISCKDDLKVTGGTLNLSVQDAALEANDSIAIADGVITVTAANDAMHAENDDDDSVGYIYISGGTLNLTCADDAIHATTIVQIDGGSMNITAAEGIEGTRILINDGTIEIAASDDGINAANKSSAYSPKVEMNGGDVTINMGQGDTDGVDANGDIVISGGTIRVNGQSTFDYDGTGTINGGTVICNGEEVTSLPNQMMGGHGGMGGGFGNQGSMPGNPGDMPGDFGSMPGNSEDMPGDFGKMPGGKGKWGRGGREEGQSSTDGKQGSNGSVSDGSDDSH